MSWLIPRAKKEHDLFRALHSNIDGHYYNIQEKINNSVFKLTDARRELSDIMEQISDMEGKQSLQAVIEVIDSCINDLKSASENVGSVKHTMILMDEITWGSCES